MSKSDNKTPVPPCQGNGTKVFLVDTRKIGFINGRHLAINVLGSHLPTKNKLYNSQVKM